jgi:peptidyl-prolyl cis-trans isomerase SurA
MNMKKLIFVTFFLIKSLFNFSQNQEIAMEINGKPILKKEFLQIYLKNNNNPKFDKQSIDEYLELYKKFKLKVFEAEELKYDTISRLKKELEGYRKTLSNSYLIDKEKNNFLIEQAYERLKTELRASHLLIEIKSNDPVDTLIAHNKINDLRLRILNGEDFNKLSSEFSNDPSATYNKGDLGFFTAFQMVFPFEEAVYNLKIGEISQIIRTKFGYHLIKLTDQRPARGTMKAAHIMVSVKKDAPVNEIESAQKKINEIYDKLTKGENFEDLALNYSDDPGSSDKGGKLPEFGSGSNTRMVLEFENESFKLLKNGDISKPFQSEFGFHIVKRLNHTPLASFETLKKEIQSKVNKDERSKITQYYLIQKLKKEYNFKIVNEKNLKWFVKNIDSNYYLGNWNYNKLKSDETLFILSNQNFTQKMFAHFLSNNFRIPKQNNKSLIKKQFENWINQEILRFEDSNLENKYPEFKSLMQEYHDGILLYDIMTDKVWNKATRDTIGLKDFYNKNIDKYQWKERIDATIYECLNKEIAQNVFKMLKLNDTINSKHILNTINKTSELNVKVKMNKYEIDELNFIKGKKINKGINPLIEFNNKFYVVSISNIIPASPKNIKEARGLVTSDYQNFLEKQWLSELSKKYSFKINEEVIYNLSK